MKVEIFTGSIRDVNDDGYLEKTINQWLADNPNIKVVDIKLSSTYWQNPGTQGLDFNRLLRRVR